MKVNSSRDCHAGGLSQRPGAVAHLNNPKLRSRSVLDCSVRLTGDLWSEGDIQMDGHLCGNINCVQLIVGKDAAVTGVVIAEEVVIRGKMTGIIRATRVVLQETARVQSEIIYRTLAVEEGASFEGMIRSRPNPFEEEFAVSPTPEAQQSISELHAAVGNESGAVCQMAGQAGTLAAAESRWQLRARPPNRSSPLPFPKHLCGSHARPRPCSSRDPS